jgi:hypothetical protein
MKREQELQEQLYPQRWHTAELQRQVRKQMILASLEHYCPLVVEEEEEKRDVTTLRHLWAKFKMTDQDDVEVLYAFFCRGSDSQSLFEGSSPWEDCLLPYWSSTFHADPKAVLAFLSNDRLSFRGRFIVPECFQDDKTLMKAICTKYPDSFLYSSTRLRDDEEFVKAA